MSTWTLKEKSVGDLEVTIEGEEWTKAVNKAFNKLARNVEISGFRKGKAPKAMIEKRIPAAERYYEAINDNANEWMRAALEENKLEPIAQPQLDVKSVDAAKAVLVFEFPVEPDAVLGEYKGLTYNVADVEVTDEEVENEITSMRERYAEMETKEGPAEKGDTVNIDYEGFKDGAAFEGGKAEGFDLELGSGSFIPGFEDQLIGASAGEEKELNLTFPEEYHAADLAGAAVVFKVKVNEVKTKVLPEVDDDFAADANIKGVSTVAELRDSIRERIEKGRKDAAENEADNALMEQLMKVTTIDLPDAMVEEETQNEIQQLASQIQQYGMSLSQYLQMMGKTADDLKADYKEQAVRNCTIRAALKAVAKAENLVPTAEELEQEFADIAEQYSMPVDQVKSVLSPEMVSKDVANKKAFDFVKENAVKAASAEETAAE